MEDSQTTSETQMELPEPELAPKATRKAKRAEPEVESAELTAAEPALPAAEQPAVLTAEQPDTASATQSAAAEPAGGAESADAEEAGSKLDRKRIEEQLEALKRRESELRRALAVADHPELAEAIRALEGCAYALSRAEGKLAQGLSKAEERRRETLEKKLAVAREKRAEIDAQIAELEGELATLTEERTRAFEAERQEAMERLLAALGTHTAALATAGLEASALVPELGRWMPEIRGLAEKLVAGRAQA
jgi:chromosome segregation ATPase